VAGCLRGKLLVSEPEGPRYDPGNTQVFFSKEASGRPRAVNERILVPLVGGVKGDIRQPDSDGGTD